MFMSIILLKNRFAKTILGEKNKHDYKMICEIFIIEKIDALYF